MSKKKHVSNVFYDYFTGPTVLGWLVGLVITAVVLPWIAAGLVMYAGWAEDKLYCATHEPFVQHSWNTNWHHCPVDREKSTA